MTGLLFIKKEHTGMNLFFWKIFWLILAAALGLIVIAGAISAFYHQSPGGFARAIQYALVLGMGVCGIVALVIVPAALYIDDKKTRRKDYDAQ
jgi:prolipoprotein diacylglyceryltransferase